RVALNAFPGALRFGLCQYEERPTCPRLAFVAGVLMFLMVVACLAAILGALAWLGVRVRRRGIGGAIMGPFEEIWHPAAHRSHQEIRVQEERMVPKPSPDDSLSGTAEKPFRRSGEARR
ncbi:hypothetical protein, partial [Micromonospora palythoicola]|uniref:hypothetical protein n=1 Tax=Micromonospora palythoicola TaxID=3120507 RepID=UPI002FCDE8B9